MAENQFFIDSDKLSEAALERKHKLETDPSSRTNHMEYMPGMEQIDPTIRNKVLSEMDSYDYNKYTARDVQNALEHETCSVEDFKALLSPAAEPFLERMAQRAKIETGKHFGNTVYLFTPLYIANYCENYCVYCGFNCYNDIHRKKLTFEEIEHEMKVGGTDSPVFPRKCLPVSIFARCAMRSKNGSAAGESNALKSSTLQVSCSNAFCTSLAVYLL